MIRLAAIALAALLAGCAGTADFRPYAPAAELRDPKAYEADLAVCRAYAAAYEDPLSLPSIASAGATGALSELPAIAASPVAVALGGAGKAGGEAASELGLSIADAKKIVATCMHDKGIASGAYHVYDPNL